MRCFAMLLVLALPSALPQPVAGAPWPLRGGVVIVVPGGQQGGGPASDPASSVPDPPADILRGAPAPGGLLRGRGAGPAPPAYVPPPLPVLPDEPVVTEAEPELPGWPPRVEQLAPPPGHEPRPAMDVAAPPGPPPAEASPRLVPPDVPLADPAR